MKTVKTLLIMATFVTILTGCGKKETNDVADKNDKKEVNTKPVTTENFEFKTNAVNFENNNSNFDVNVKNITNKEVFLKEFLIHVKDDNGEDLATLFGYVNETIEAGGERTISCSFGGDLSNYKSLEFEVIE